MSRFGQIFTRIGATPFFLAGAGLMLIGVVLQVTGMLVLPDLGGLATTPFGLFSKLGGACILLGLAIFAVHGDGSGEPDVHIPDDLPRSARSQRDDAV